MHSEQTMTMAALANIQRDSSTVLAADMQAMYDYDNVEKGICWKRQTPNLNKLDEMRCALQRMPTKPDSQ